MLKIICHTRTFNYLSHISTLVFHSFLNCFCPSFLTKSFCHRKIVLLFKTKPMKATVTKSFLSLFICSNYLILKAQPDLLKFEVGINAGAFIYQGDLTPSRLGSYRTLKPGLGIFVNRIISPIFSLRTNFEFGKLKGDDGKFWSVRIAHCRPSAK